MSSSSYSCSLSFNNHKELWMSLPDFPSFFRPLLDICSDGEEHSLSEVRQKLAKMMSLSKEDLADKVPSGVQTRFNNRVQWAKTYFVQAKVLTTTRRAHFKITERGRKLHSKNHNRIDVKILKQYPEFFEFHSPQKQDDSISESTSGHAATPEEILLQAYQNIRHELASDLLSRIKNNDPEFFEKLVVDLLVSMGYGGSRIDAGESIGKSGDEGIDGIIKEDRLGLDVIYIQAKKWEGTVGRPEIQKFVGALHGKRAQKGVFITTGVFSAEATNYVKQIDPKVILIDGKTLCNYMIDFNIGVNASAIYELKKVDSDYFDED